MSNSIEKSNNTDLNSSCFNKLIFMLNETSISDYDLFLDKDLLLKDLNLQQQKAVTKTEGRIRVLAGAGSGKTRVIAHRYANLVNNIGIHPSAILCTTFIAVHNF